VGGDGNSGDLFVDNGDGQHRIHLDGGTETNISTTTRVYINGTQGNIRLGGPGSDGDLMLFPSSVTDILDTSQATIYLSGNAGDIRLSGADCAEQFEVDSDIAPEAGTVLVLTSSGKLSPCRQAYDRGVVGVVSGAGGLRPGVILNQQKTEQEHVPVALIGKVYCKVDASYGPIHLGDFLTTSVTLGHAMKAADAGASFGSVIGKALGAINEGCGMIPILVTLQ
jgi:hypothetical protein